jgi:hypothetical protein
MGPNVWEDEVIMEGKGYPHSDILALKAPRPDLTPAENAALDFRPDSIYPILLDWIKEDPGGASAPRRMIELYSILQEVALTRGHVWHWTNEGALALHMRGKFIGEGLRKHLGMVVEKRWHPEYGQWRLWYSFHVPHGVVEHGGSIDT